MNCSPEGTAFRSAAARSVTIVFASGFFRPWDDCYSRWCYGQTLRRRMGPAFPAPPSQEVPRLPWIAVVVVVVIAWFAILFTGPARGPLRRRRGRGADGGSGRSLRILFATGR